MLSLSKWNIALVYRCVLRFYPKDIRGSGRVGLKFYINLFFACWKNIRVWWSRLLVYVTFTRLYIFL